MFSLLKRVATNSPRAYARHYSSRVPQARDWGVRRPLPARQGRGQRSPRAITAAESSANAMAYDPFMRTPPTPPEFVAHRTAMKENFPEGWAPPRKLSREAMDGLRTLHAHDPEQFSTPMLSDKFQISPEAVRRILKSRWVPNDERRGDMMLKEREMRIARSKQRREEEKKKEREKAVSGHTEAIKGRMQAMFSTSGWSR